MPWTFLDPNCQRSLPTLTSLEPSQIFQSTCITCRDHWIAVGKASTSTSSISSLPKENQVPCWFCLYFVYILRQHSQVWKWSLRLPSTTIAPICFNFILDQWNGLEPPARWAGATMQQHATALQKRHWLCLFHWWHLFLIIFGYFWIFLVVQCWVLNISHCFEHKTSEPCQCRRFDWNCFVSKWRLIGKCHDQGADGNPYADTSISIRSTL